jgi:hypothetical protein
MRWQQKAPGYARVLRMRAARSAFARIRVTDLLPVRGAGAQRAPQQQRRGI